MHTVDRATAAGERRATRPSRADAEPAVVELLRLHGGRLMAVARRVSTRTGPGRQPLTTLKLRRFGADWLPAASVATKLTR
jgi:hypothetical protein